MNYCSLEDAWGNDFSESRKVKKPKRLYTLKNQPHIYNTSMRNSHDKHCNTQEPRVFTVKNKERYHKSRTHKDIYRPENKGRVNNINVMYDNANKEYKKYKKESKKMMKNRKDDNDIIENDIENRNYINNYSGIDEDNYSDMEQLPPSEDMSDNYTINDSKNLQQEMYKLQKEQNTEIERQQELLQEQMRKQGMGNDMQSPEYFQGKYNYDTIESFENNNLNNNSYEKNTQNNEENDNKNKTEEENKINDIDTESESDSEPENDIVTNNEKNKETKSKNINILDKLLQNKGGEDIEENIEDNKDNIDYRLNTLNRNVNSIIKILKESNFFEEDSQENIHDIILFILFGIFILFILDTIYRIGTNKPTIQN